MDEILIDPITPTPYRVRGRLRLPHPRLDFGGIFDKSGGVFLGFRRLSDSLTAPLYKADHVP